MAKPDEGWRRKKNGAVYNINWKNNRRIQYASSDERDDVIDDNEDIKERQIKNNKKAAIQKEIEKWESIQLDPYESPYLKEKSVKELRKLRKKLDNLE